MMLGRAQYPSTPSLYETTITHVRSAPVTNRFTYSSYWWFVDIDRLPTLPAVLRPFAQFRAADHFGDPQKTLRENVDAFLAGHDIDLRGGRVTMLASARVLGYVFNPLSVFWCHDRDGALVCVIAEVHNTYGQRHSYLLHTDERGRARAAKQFYVSPFNDVDGEYRMSLPEPGAELGLTITLHREDQPPFVARVGGRRRPGTAASLTRLLATHPVAPLVAAVRIRIQGITLWRRGLPVIARPEHSPQEAVQ